MSLATTLDPVSNLLIDGRRAWLISTPNTQLVLSVDADGALLVDHWGATLGSETMAIDGLLPRPWNRPSQSHFLDGVPLAYSVYGEASFKEPCLAVRFLDGTRNVAFVWDSDDIQSDDGRTTLALRFVDPEYSLHIEHRFTVFAGHDVIVRAVRLTNGAAEPVQIERALTASWGLPPGDYDSWLMQGRGWGDEFHAARRPIQPGKVVAGSRNGYTSREAHPWFAVTSEERGGDEGAAPTWFGALAWSGNWTMSLETERNGAVHITAGVNPFDFRWHLEPGETFETPALVSGYTDEGLAGSRRAFHRYAVEHVLPANHRETLRPVHYNSWFSTEFDVRVHHQIQLAKRAADLGAELFVVDDGWFGERKSEHAGLGDWVVDPDKFPNGLDELIEAVHGLGMQFGIWVEPEMVNPDSDLYRAHPDWVYHFPKRKGTLARHQLVLNFARDDVWEEIYGQLERLLSNHQIDFVKWDHNRPYTQPGWPEAPPERAQEMWVRHVQGVYRMMAALRDQFPHLLLETCAGGGGRVDLGMLAVTDQSWVSDNTDASDRLNLQYNYSRIYPPRTMVDWVTDVPNHETDREPPLRFRFHVAMQGVLGISADIVNWNQSQLHEAKRLVADYKSVQDIIQQGDQHWLIAPEAVSGRAAVQYVSPDRARIVTFHYQVRGVISEGYRRVKLRDLDPQAAYRREGDGLTVSGAALMSAGVPLFPPSQPLTDWRSDMQVWQRVAA